MNARPRGPISGSRVAKFPYVARLTLHWEEHPIQLSDRFHEALAYASSLHADQRRNGTSIPYVSHLLAVCGKVLEAGGDEDQAIAGLLHDAVEDQGGVDTLEDIRKRFGDRVARIVLDCTDSVADPKPDWRPRKEAYIASLANKPVDSLLVSICDKQHNAECIVRDLREHGERVWSRFSANRDEVIWYYETIADVFTNLLPGREAARLSAAVDALASA